jgi:ADP-heptose:LPS heptosyltransferase
MVLDLQGLLRSGLYAALTGCPVRIGFHDSREGSRWFYSHRIEVSNAVVHAVDRGLELVRRIGVSGAAPPSFPIPDGSKERQWVDLLWRRHRIGDRDAVCVIHPSARWETKRWPAARFAQLADALAAKEGIRIIIVGSGSEASRTDEMARHIAQTAVDLTGKTDLLQLAALLRRSDLLVTNDSGPMHLAAAVGTPVVAIFGPTDPARVGPYGAGHIVLRKEVDCSRCSRGSCVRDALCLKAVGVAEVLESVRTILSRAPQPAASAGIGKLS